MRKQKEGGFGSGRFQQCKIWEMKRNQVEEMQPVIGRKLGECGIEKPNKDCCKVKGMFTCVKSCRQVK